MKTADPITFFLLAGEPSGDRLGAELVEALRGVPSLQARPFAPRFLGAGGPRMAAAGVEIVRDLTRHAVVGFFEVVRQFNTFRRLFRELLDLTCRLQPDVVIGIDYSGFNRRFAHALRQRTSARGWFRNWQPKLVQYVSPQVWASRPGRAHALEQDLDLLICLFPFEKPWYARRTPRLRVEFAGHPVVDRHGALAHQRLMSPVEPDPSNAPPRVVLLPGSRRAELERHLPPMVEAARILRREYPLDLIAVAPDEALEQTMRSRLPREAEGFHVRFCPLPEALSTATVAMASTGTVTLECAVYGLPTVALYRTSWGTYQVAKHLAQVQYLAMPNLIAGEELYPEFLQERATAENLARATGELLTSPARRQAIRNRLREVVASLGGTGASTRAADAIASLLPEPARTV